MRARSTKLKAHVASSLALGVKELTRRIGIRDHRNPDHVQSEVLATIVRTRYGNHQGVVTAAVEELNGRLIRETTNRWRRVAYLPHVRRRGNQFVEDAVTYMWDRLLEENGPLSNAETAFIVFVRDRFEEFVRHLGTTSNDMDSVDGMDVTDEEGNRDSFVSTQADPNAETPEEALIRAQDRDKLNQILLEMSKIERDAFLFRAEYGYEWARVADLLHCSIPTARAHYGRANDKLLGALK